MPTPGFSHHLNDLIEQLMKLAEAMRAANKYVEPWPRSPLSVCPKRVLKQSCWRVGDEAFFHHVDVMRRYHWHMPLLNVDGLMLASVLTDLMRLAIVCCGERGAVVCGLHNGPKGLRFSVSDSSGVTGREKDWLEGCTRRHDLLSKLEQDALVLGGQLLVSVHEGEGVVVELLFPPELCALPLHYYSGSVVANDAGPTSCQEPLRG